MYLFSEELSSLVSLQVKCSSYIPEFLCNTCMSALEYGFLRKEELTLFVLYIQKIYITRNLGLETYTTNT